MGNLIKVGSSQLAKTSLGKALQRHRLESTEFVLLLDTSGSMADRMQSGVRKIERLWESVLPIIDQSPQIRVYEFNSSFSRLLPPYDMPDARGGTDLAMALRELRGNAVILVTDGLPESKSKALEAARGIKKMNIIYIGDPNPDAENFLRDLARVTGGGVYEKVNLEAGAKFLENKIKGLLVGA